MTNPRIPYEMAHQRKKLAPPDGKPLIVHLVVNVEHWRFDNRDAAEDHHRPPRGGERA